MTTNESFYLQVPLRILLLYLKMIPWGHFSCKFTYRHRGLPPNESTPAKTHTKCDILTYPCGLAICQQVLSIRK